MRGHWNDVSSYKVCDVKGGERQPWGTSVQPAQGIKGRLLSKFGESKEDLSASTRKQGSNYFLVLQLRKIKWDSQEKTDSQAGLTQRAIGRLQCLPY